MKYKDRLYRMLPALVLLILLLILPLSMACAQSDAYESDTAKVNRRVIKIHPLQLGEIYLSHEKMRTERISNEIGLSYIYHSYLKGDDWMPERANAQGLAVRMSQRKYTTKDPTGSPYGFFHGPVFGYRLLVFDENVFGLPDQNPQSPDSRIVGRLYENSLDLGYHLGMQFEITRHLTTEVAAGFGGRVKLARASNADELLTEHIIGRAVAAEKNSAIFVSPLPHLKLSLGYSF
jgi:hypothetical protein